MKWLNFCFECLEKKQCLLDFAFLYYIVDFEKKYHIIPVVC